MKTAQELKSAFPFAGGVELAAAAIAHLGEGIIEQILPIYEAICKTQGDGGHVAYLAEALQYRSMQNLNNLAEFGLDLDKMYLLEYGLGSHAMALRAESIRRVVNGEEPCYRKLLQDHDYTQGKPPFITHDKDVMEFIARREKASK